MWCFAPTHCSDGEVGKLIALPVMRSLKDPAHNLPLQSKDHKFASWLWALGTAKENQENNLHIQEMGR